MDTFNAPVDKDNKPSQFKEGNFIQIDIDAPASARSFVKISSIQETDNSLTATFVTMEGHVEKGIITFRLTQDENGNVSFSLIVCHKLIWELPRNLQSKHLAMNKRHHGKR